MAKKRQNKKVKQLVDPVKVLNSDLKRVGIWCGIALGITFVVAFVVNSMVL
ncbi:hypothetical protein [Marininema halotolerans]|uniref:Uncharacterized protein n=1 Tax=Marininema halotolerans TaxID=1155944 RepID=A0A1I6NQU4_9BACL|nr:hypothetical protein [Marininema halotolerans]SFS30260.1 hypothetical protein SAMN05444972_10129 [Marininema halotolerans]